MREVLDEIEADKPVAGRVYSILSFSFAMLTIVLGSILMGMILYNENALFLWRPPMLLVRGFQIACLAGLVFAIASIVKKEKLPYLKAIGAVLNFLIFGFILALIAFAAIIDMNRHE
jgi:MFS family permease